MTPLQDVYVPVLSLYCLYKYDYVMHSYVYEFPPWLLCVETATELILIRAIRGVLHIYTLYVGHSTLHKDLKW